MSHSLMWFLKVGEMTLNIQNEGTDIFPTEKLMYKPLPRNWEICNISIEI